MAKERERIPAKTREQVLKEYSHLCAKCAKPNPQLHHIDDNPSNNDPMNLIPLCPNHHLTDQHNPTKRIETDILRLFRQYKDPMILTPQFQPLYKRMGFLDDIETDSALSPREITEHANRLEFQARVLVRFVSSLEMGTAYARELAQLLQLTGERSIKAVDAKTWQTARYRSDQPAPAERYAKEIREVQSQVQDLVVEVLRFQDWKLSE